MCNGKFLKSARNIIADWYKEKEGITLRDSDIGLISISKVLDNNHGLFAVHPYDDGLYFRVTFNGANNEFYLDVLAKRETVTFPA